MPDEAEVEAVEGDESIIGVRKRTMQRFHFEQKQIYEKEEFNNARSIMPPYLCIVFFYMFAFFFFL
jgi:hypothetical protein